MVQHKHKLIGNNIPKQLRSISSAPKELFVQGTPLDDWIDKPILAVVGTRKMSSYGRFVVENIVGELAGKGIVIVSGLALGVDACAHKTALDANGTTIAILPTSLDNIQPRENLRLAKRILDSGGALISEYPSGSKVNRANFVARNRLVSGIANAVLIIEAAENSGTMHTAEYALKQKKPLLIIPGPINSPLSKGPNELLKRGAIPITDVEDVLTVLGVNTSDKKQLELLGGTNEELVIIELIKSGLNDGNELQHRSELSPEIFSQTLTMLELQGHIKNAGNNQWFI